MSHCEFKLAKATTEEGLEEAIREAGKQGWYRTSPNCVGGDLPVMAFHYCVLSRIQPAVTTAVHSGGRSFHEATQSSFWRNGVGHEVSA